MCAVPFSKRPADLRRYRRLVDAVKKVYPIAKTARAKMAEMEAELLRCRRKRNRKPTSNKSTTKSRTNHAVLKHMTRTQGRVLLKLIDRETTARPTTYCANPRRIRGGILAGHLENLAGPQVDYDKEGEDRIIERS